MAPLTAEERTQNRAASVAKYNASDKARARRHAYEATPKGRAKDKRYKASVTERNSSPDWEPPTEQTCSGCWQTLPAEMFNRRTDTKTGLQYVCKPCLAERSRMSKYGLSQETYDAMIWLQDNTCAICPKSFDDETVYVDHDHATGAVRGLLCLGCNVSIGHFADDVAVLRRAISYLELSA